MRDLSLFNKALKLSWVKATLPKLRRSVAEHPEVPASECWGPRALQM